MVRRFVHDRLRSVRASSVFGALRGRLARASLGSFLLKGIGTVIAFGYSLLLARLLGVAQYGIYEFVVAWVALLAVPSVFGFDKVLLRVLPAAAVDGDWGEARGLMRWTTIAVAGGSLVVAAVAGGLAWRGAGATPWPFLIGCAALPLFALSILWEGALRGLHRIVEGQMPITIVRPLIAAAVAALLIVALGAPARAETALLSLAAGALVAAATSAFLYRLRAPRELRRATASYRPRRWVSIGAPIMVMTGMAIANNRIGTIALGTLGSAEAAGVFAVLGRASELIPFALVAVNAAVAPAFSELHAAGDRDRLQRVVTRSARLTFALAAPIALGLWFFGEAFLQLYGGAFVEGSLALRILVAAQLVNITMGPAGVLLVMTGHERVATAGFALAVAINAALCFALVPSAGVVGAAIAATASIVVWNVALAVLAVRLVGVHATALGGRTPHAPRSER